MRSAIRSAYSAGIWIRTRARAKHHVERPSRRFVPGQEQEVFDHVEHGAIHDRGVRDSRDPLGVLPDRGLDGLTVSRWCEGSAGARSGARRRHGARKDRAERVLGEMGDQQVVAQLTCERKGAAVVTPHAPSEKALASIPGLGCTRSSLVGMQETASVPRPSESLAGSQVVEAARILLELPLRNRPSGDKKAEAHARSRLDCPFGQVRTVDLSTSPRGLDLEEQCRVGRNDSAGSARAVSEIRRDQERPLAADLHRRDALVPSLDHASCPIGKENGVPRSSELSNFLPLARSPTASRCSA